jgi:hypothetical protein
LRDRADATANRATMERIHAAAHDVADRNRPIAIVFPAAEARTVEDILLAMTSRHDRPQPAEIDVERGPNVVDFPAQ